MPVVWSVMVALYCFSFFFQAEDGIRDYKVTGVQTCALPICDPLLLTPFVKGDPNANNCSRVVDQKHCIGDIDKSVVNTVGFTNMPSNFATQFEDRKSVV